MSDAEYQRGFEMLERGSLAQASTFLQECYKKGVDNFGKVHHGVFKIQHLLAQVYELQGKYEEAYKLLKELHKNQLATFGPNQEETLTTLHSTAAVLCELGKSDEALPIFSDVHAKRKSLLGLNHKDTLATYSCLVNIQGQRGQNVLPTLKSIFEIQKQRYPLDQTTFVTGWNIATQMIKNGDTNEALVLLNKMFDIQSTTPGLYRGSLQTLSSIADVYTRHGKLKEAMDVYNDLLARYEKLYGKDHPKVLNTEQNMSTLWLYQLNFKQGLKCLNTVYNKQKNLFGEEHLDTILTISKIAGAYSLMGQHKLALFFYQKAYDVEKRKFPTLAKSMYTYQGIGSVLKNLKRYDEAVAVYREIYNAMKHLGSDNQRLLELESLIANSYFYKGDYEKALASYAKVFEIQEKKLGDDNPETLSTQSSIALIHVQKGNYRKALEIYDIVLNIQQACLGPNTKAAITTQTNIALVYSLQKRYRESTKQYKEVLKKMSATLGPNHPELLTIQSKLASVLMEQGKTESALNMFREILPKMEDFWGKDNSDTLKVKKHIEDLQRNHRST